MGQDDGGINQATKAIIKSQSIFHDLFYVPNKYPSPRQYGPSSPLLSITKKQKEEMMKGKHWANQGGAGNKIPDMTYIFVFKAKGTPPPTI